MHLENGKCNDEADINFELTGFRLEGRIQGSDHCDASIDFSGITVSLEDAKAVSDSKGRFVFENVPTGEHSMRVEDSDWLFTPKEVKFLMPLKSLQLDAVFTVNGFSISGKVKEPSGEAVEGVSFLLYSHKNETIQGCDPVTDTRISNIVNSQKYGKPVCRVYSKSDGSFLIPGVPCGEYTVIPFYVGSDSAKFDVVPNEVAVQLTSKPLTIAVPFIVKGFTLKGRVVNSKEVGIQGVEISVPGSSYKAVTDSKGQFAIEQVTSGTYTMQASKVGYKFAPLKNIKITPSNNILPNIVSTFVDVCGRLYIPHPPKGVPTTNRVISVKGEHFSQTVRTGPSGEFCVSVPSSPVPLSYTFTAEVSSSERKMGLALAEESIMILVDAVPLNNINFVQNLLTIKGQVKCITSPCDPSTSVTLKTETSDPITIALSSLTDEKGRSVEQFIFQGIIPGRYSVVINKNTWCWDQEKVDLVITDHSVDNVKFVQTGFKMSVQSSHDMNMTVQSDSFETTFSVKANKTTAVCLPSPGQYKVVPSACYLFDKDLYVYSTSNPKVLQYNVRNVQLQGAIKTSGPSDDITLYIDHLDSHGKPIPAPVRTQVVLEPTTDGTVYPYQIWGTVGDHIRITPKAKTLLFYPQFIDVTVSDTSCPNLLSDIEGRQALFLEGNVTPAIDGVEITVYNAETNEKIQDTFTSYRDGVYRVGPLYDHLKYTVDAKASGFYLRKAGERDFQAQKLGSIEIHVIETVDGVQKGMEGVLLSLSGESYRKNLKTGENGRLTFNQLFPGDYYLMSFLKEYEFDNTNNPILVKEGEVLHLKIQATRVAYSCYGKVSSLNGNAQNDIMVEAVSSDGLTEDTKTDNDGKYRIRGLIPNKDYEIRIKSTPTTRQLNENKVVRVGQHDIQDIHLIVLKENPVFEVYGHVFANASYLPYLTVKIHEYNDNKTGSLVNQIALSKDIDFYTFSGLQQGKYLLKIDVNVSRDAYSIDTEALSQVITCEDLIMKSQKFDFMFDAKTNLETQEIPSTPFYTTLIILVLITLFYNRKALKKFYYKKLNIKADKKKSKYKDTWMDQLNKDFYKR